MLAAQEATEECEGEANGSKNFNALNTSLKSVSDSIASVRESMKS